MAVVNTAASWLLAGHSLLVGWLLRMLPIPKITHTPLTCSMRCSTWAWWPTIRSTSPEAVTASATSRWNPVISATFSCPQWKLTMTASAPRARSARASSITH